MNEEDPTEAKKQDTWRPKAILLLLSCSLTDAASSSTYSGIGGKRMYRM